jgi:hypothetical protein
MDVSNLPHKLFVHACARGRKYGWVLTFQPFETQERRPGDGSVALARPRQLHLL